MYINKFGHLSLQGASASPTLTATGVSGSLWLCHSKTQISALSAIVTTVFSSTAPCVVQYLDRPTPGSATGQVVIGTLTIGSASGVAAVGSIWTKNIAPYNLLMGHQLALNVSTAVTSSGAAFFGFENLDAPENFVNEANVNVSA